MKFPAVPRTGDIFLLYRSLTQRSASMGTRIVESIEAAIEVKKGNACRMARRTEAGGPRGLMLALKSTKELTGRPRAFAT